MKECNWCKSQVNKDAKVCPNCGKQIWEKKHKKGIKIVGIILGIIVFFLLMIIILLSLEDPNVEEKCKNAEYGNLEEIYNLHAKNVPQAEEKYKDKYFKFSGKVYKTYNNYIQIDSDYISAFVYFNSDNKDKAIQYNQGDEIKYCGKISFGTGINVKNAIIIDEN